MRFCWRRWASRASFALSAVAAVAPLSAQGPADRQFVDSLLVKMAAAPTASALPPVTTCAPRGGALARLCDGLLSARLADLDSGKAARKAATHARDVLEHVVSEQPAWATAWYGLAMARLQATRAGAGWHTGPLQAGDESNESGAVSALIRALELEPTFALAARALAVVPIPHANGGRLADRVAALQRVRALLPPEALYGMALVEREAGNLDSALALWRVVAEWKAAPRGVLALEMARDLFALKRDSAGTAQLLAGASDTASLSRQAYHRELAWVASPVELGQWDSTSSSARPAWLRNFWALRDVRDGRPAGARIAEHYLRMREAFAWFRFTCPDDCDLAPHAITGEIDDHVEDVAAPVIAKMPFRHLQSSSDVLDDRGVIYVRQGGPNKGAMRTTDGAGWELWGYDRAGTPLFLDFSPNMDPKRVAQLDPYNAYPLAELKDSAGEAIPAWLIDRLGQPGHPRYGTYYAQDFCALKPSLCKAFPDTVPTTNPRVNCNLDGPEFDFAWNDQRLTPAGRDPRFGAATLMSLYQAPPNDIPYIMAREREEALWADTLAMTTDAFPIPLTKLLAPAVDLHVLGHARGGTPRVVIAYAIPGEQLARDAAAAVSGKVMYPLRVHAIAFRARDGLRIDLDTTRQFNTPSTLDPGEYVTGQVEFNVPVGTYTVTVVLMQADGRGAVVHLADVTVPDRTGPLRVSDLILGGEGSGITWNSDATTVSLNPLRTYAHGSTAQIYFQLSGLVPGATYQTRFEFYRSEDDSTRAPRLALTFTDVAAHDWQEEVRALGLQSLDAGDYRIKLVVQGEGKDVTASGCLTVRK